MIKLLHLHSDIKFAFDTLKFVNERIYNQIILIGEIHENHKNQLEVLGIPYLIIEKKDTSLQQILEKSNEFDAVVFYGLSAFHESVLRNLPESKSKFLRFFGYEIYGLIPQHYLSKRTMELYYPIPFVKRHFHLYLKKRVFRFLKNEFKVDLVEQKEIYQKLDAILMLNEFEYSELASKFWLPPFLQIPLNAGMEKMNINTPKSNQIIVGNSRHMWNNHLDVFKLIRSFSRKGDPSFLIFFKFGKLNRYTEIVREEAGNNPNIKLIEDFLPLDEFDNLYRNSSALVINSYRQHALGNIFTGFFSGCKIYLNDRSSTYKWFKSQGFHVFEIDQLKSDILKNDYQLTHEQKEANIQAYFELKSKNPTTYFIDQIIKLIKKK